MAVTAKMYGKAFLAAFNKEIDLDTDVVKVALCTASYTPDQDAHDYFDDITNELSTGSGYTAGGATLASKSVTYTGGTNTFAFDAADVSWTSATITARYAIVYVSTGTASTSPLLCCIDFGENVSSTNATFSIVFHADGIFKVVVD